MKKYLWLVIALVGILVTFYGRTLFLNNSGTVEVSQVTKNNLNDPLNSKATDQSVFPPKNKILKIPTPTWPPFYMENDQGQWIGAVPDIVKPVLNRMGYQVEFIGMPFARALEEMKGGLYPALAACVIGGGREEYILFSEPVTSIYSVLWKKNDDPRCWQTYNDLTGRTVGVSPFHYGAGFIEAAERGVFKIDEVAANAPEVIHFRKLLQGKTDMFICELSVGLYLQNKYVPEFDNADYCPTGVGLARPYSFAISRAFFKGQNGAMHAFVDAFNKELSAFAKEGKRQKVFEQYNMKIEQDKEGGILFPEGYEQSL